MDNSEEMQVDSVVDTIYAEFQTAFRNDRGDERDLFFLTKNHANVLAFTFEDFNTRLPTAMPVTSRFFSRLLQGRPNVNVLLLFLFFHRPATLNPPWPIGDHPLCSWSPGQDIE